MRVLYIITQADGGGAQKYVLQMAAHFQGAIAAGDEAQKLFDDAAKLNVQTFKLRHLKRKRGISPVHDILALFEIRELIKKYKPDIVHLNSSRAGFLGSLAATGLKVKVIFTAHGFVFNEPLSKPLLWILQKLEKFASRFRDFIITVSDADRAAAIKNNIINENKIATVHNGIAKIEFVTKEGAREKLGLRILHKKIIGTVANDYATKGLGILEQASPLIKANAITYVFGHNPKVGMVTNDGKFEYRNFQPTIAQLLKAFDILVIPSRKEGFPFLLLEAMQAGLPIIATQVGGIPEAVGDAAILVKPENPVALATAIDDLLANNEKMHQLSQKALERSKLFTEDKMFAETEQIYKKMLTN